MILFPSRALMGLALGAAVASCTAPKPGFEADAPTPPDAGEDESQPDAGEDKSQPDAAIPPDASSCGLDCPLGCHPTEPRCNEVAPSNGLAPYLDLAAQAADLALPDGVIINTDDGSITDAEENPILFASELIPAPEGGVAIRVFSVNTLTIGDATVVGDAAIAFVSAGDIVVDGVVAVSAGAVNEGACLGEPGDKASTCPVQGECTSGGYGGAGFGTFGGDGGDVYDDQGDLAFAGGTGGFKSRPPRAPSSARPRVSPRSPRANPRYIFLRVSIWSFTRWSASGFLPSVRLR